MNGMNGVNGVNGVNETLVLPLETLSLAAADALETMIELDELGAHDYTAERILQLRPDLDHGALEIEEGLKQLERLGYAGRLCVDERGLPVYSYSHCGTVLGFAAIKRDRKRHHEAALDRQAALRAPRGRVSMLAAGSAL